MTMATHMHLMDDSYNSPLSNKYTQHAKTKRIYLRHLNMLY